MARRLAILLSPAFAAVWSLPLLTSPAWGQAAPAATDTPAAASATPATEPVLKREEIGQITPVHSCGTTLLSGQPTQTDLQLLKDRGIKTILSVRTEGEIDWDEDAAVKLLGMQFVNVPFRGTDQLNDEVFDKVLKVLRDPQQQPVMIHCGSASRVGAVWYAYRRLDGKLSAEDAAREAQTIGLRPGAVALLARAEEYIAKEQAKAQAQAAPSGQSPPAPAASAE